MGGADLVSYRDEHLEQLRALVLFKSELRSPELKRLLTRVENPSLSRVFEGIVEDALPERVALEQVIADWSRARRAPEPPPERIDVSLRDVVAEWAGLLAASARRARLAALAAPTPEIRSRLERLADADEERAAALLRHL